MASVVYFAQSGDDGPIKIGLSGDVDRRIQGLQTGSAAPLRLLAVEPGDHDWERTLHNMFAASRTSGEWFRPTEDLRAYIRSVVEVHGVPSAEALAAPTSPVCQPSEKRRRPRRLKASPASMFYKAVTERGVTVQAIVAVVPVHFTSVYRWLSADTAPTAQHVAVLIKNGILALDEVEGSAGIAAEVA